MSEFIDPDVPDEALSQLYIPPPSDNNLLTHLPTENEVEDDEVVEGTPPPSIFTDITFEIPDTPPPMTTPTPLQPTLPSNHEPITDNTNIVPEPSPPVARYIQEKKNNNTEANNRTSFNRFKIFVLKL